MTSRTYGFGARSYIALIASIISVLAFLVFLVPGSVFAAGNTFYVNASAPAGGDGSSAHPYQTIQSAVTAATAGDTVHIDGTQNVTSAIALNMPLTIEGGAGAEIDTTGAGYVFSINPGAAGTTVKSLIFNKTDTVNDDAMILVNAANVTISSDTFKSVFNIGDSQTVRGLDVSGVTGVSIHDNTFSHVRQPAYVNNASGSIANNYTEVTKGWVVVSEAPVSFTGNTWGTALNANVDDIVYVVDNPVGANNNTDVLAISQANNNAFVLNKASTPFQQSASYVDDSTGNDGNDGSALSPLKSITAAITRTVAGGTVHVAAGTYTGPLTITKNNLSLVGTTGVTVAESATDSFGYPVTVDNASGVTISDIAFNAAALTSGYALHAYHADGLTLANVSFTGPGRISTHIGGVDLNTSSNVTLNSVSSTGFYKNGFAVTAAYAASDNANPSSNITFNNVTATGDGWSGISFYTIGNDHSPASIGGAASITGVHFTGTNTVGGDTQIGLHIQGDTDANESAFATPAYTVTTDGTTLELGTMAFLPSGLNDVVNYQTAGVDAMNATFDGTTGSQKTQSQRDYENGVIFDHLDRPAYGLVKFYEADTTVDAPTILIPATDGIVTNNANLPKIDWTDVTDPSSPVTYTYEVATSPAVNADGSFVSPIYNPGPLTASENVNGGTPDGVYYFHVQAVDGVGNKSAWTPVMKVTVDSTAPSTPILTSPENGTTLPTNDFDFTWQASTDATPVTYQFQSSLNPAQTDGVLTGGLWQSGTLTDPMIHSSGAPDGTWYWQVQATDAAGNKSAWSPIWNVTLAHPVADSEAPVVTVTPEAGSNLSGTVAFTITVTDNQPLDPSKLSHIWVYLYNAEGAQKQQGANVDLSSGTGTFTVDTTKLDNGSAWLDVGQLFDAAGNASGAGDTYFKNYVIDNEVAPPAAVPSVTTDTASDVTSSDATINGTNGPVDADGHSLWVSENDFSTDSTNMPVGVYSTPDFGSISANSPFSAQLSLVTTNGITHDGVPGNMPALTAGTTYHYVAWVHTLVSGWIHGDMKTVTLSDEDSGEGDTLATPAGTFPDNGATLSDSDLNHVAWTSVSDAHTPTSYVYEVSYSEDTNDDGSFTTPIDIGDRGHVTTNEVVTGGTPEGTYYWHVRATDSAGTNSDWSDTESFTIKNTAVHANHAPTADNQSMTVTSGMSGSLVLGGHDEDNDDLTYSVSTNPSHGSVSLTSSTATYIPAENYVGPDSFTYGVSDGTVTTPTNGTVSITVTPAEHENQTPTAQDQDVATDQDTPVAITLQGTDPDTGDTLTYNVVTGPANGSLSANSGQVVTYTPAAGTSGDDSFTFTVTDNHGAVSDEATVSIAVSAAPTQTATNDSGSNTRTVGGGGGGGGFSSFSTGSGSTGTGVSGQVLGAAAFNFTRDLHIGMTGADVTELQTELITAGYLKVKAVTGFFGALTRAAVAEWQAEHGITPASGYFGPISRAKYALDGGFFMLVTPVTSTTTSTTATTH